MSPPNNKTRIQGEEFPGHCSQLRMSPSNNHRAPVVQVTKGLESHNNVVIPERLEDQQPDDKSREHQEYET